MTWINVVQIFALVVVICLLAFVRASILLALSDRKEAVNGAVAGTLGVLGLIICNVGLPLIL